MGGKSYWLFVIGYWGRIRRSRFLKERGHLAHLFNSGRAMRPRGADSFRKDSPQSSGVNGQVKSLAERSFY
jgi:hypothetical protein